MFSGIMLFFRVYMSSIYSKLKLTFARSSILFYYPKSRRGLLVADLTVLGIGFCAPLYFSNTPITLSYATGVKIDFGDSFCYYALLLGYINYSISLTCDC